MTRRREEPTIYLRSAEARVTRAGRPTCRRDGNPEPTLRWCARNFNPTVFCRRAAGHSAGRVKALRTALLIRQRNPDRSVGRLVLVVDSANKAEVAGRGRWRPSQLIVIKGPVRREGHHRGRAEVRPCRSYRRLAGQHVMLGVFIDRPRLRSSSRSSSRWPG